MLGNRKYELIMNTLGPDYSAVAALQPFHKEKVCVELPKSSALNILMWQVQNCPLSNLAQAQLLQGDTNDRLQ